jgi:hypothetical protein
LSFLGILVLTWLTADAGSAPPRFEWKIPEASAWVDVPGTLRVQGVPMKVKTVRSKWRAPELLQHVAKMFEDAGLYIAPPERQPQILSQVQLTALDPASLHTYTVIFQPNEDATTTLYLAEAAPAAREQPRGNDLPVFPGAKGRITSQLEGARTVAFTAEAKPEVVEQFYTETFTSAGFKAVGGGKYVQGRREITVSISPVGSMVRVLVWDRGGPPDDALRGGERPEAPK